MARKPVLERIRERKERHKQRGKLYRVSFATVGVLLVMAGVVLSLPLVPGPGIFVLAIGLAMLALEFDRAERLLERVLVRVERASEAAMRFGTLEKTLAVATLAVAAAVAIGAVLLWDVPFLPL